METPPPPAPLPSGTVVVVREDPSGLELLLLQRAPKADGKPGPWVFPGGRVEPGDRRAGAPEREDALHASVRETREEAGLDLAPEALTLISRWITPEISPKRFDTWFFLGIAARDRAVRVDGSEMCDHRWLRPADALDLHHAKHLRLAPPTFVTVSWLVPHADIGAARRALGDRELPPFRPRIHRLEDGACMLYPGDAGYELGDLERPGPRHRLWATPPAWRYEQDALHPR